MFEFLFKYPPAIFAKGKFVLLPITDATRGHGTHTLPAIWSQYLADLLRES